MYSTDKFTWHKETRTLSAEASDLGVFMLDKGPFNERRISLQSARTGAVAEFQLANVDKRDGDLRAWEFTPTLKSAIRTPALAGVKIVIFND